jgi:RNase H-fold protein (predicted Holliday junction resolvase)
MVGKAAGKTGGGLLRLGATLLRFGPAGAVGLAIAGMAVAADKLRDMNIDSTVKDISDKNAALKAAIESGNEPLVKTLTAELARDLKRLQDTTIGNVASVQEQIKIAQNTLAEEATKNLANSLAKLQEKSLRNADGSVAEGAAEALRAIKKALNKQVQELLVGNKARTTDQIKEKEDKTLTFLNNLRKDLNDNKISPEDQKEVISKAVEQILAVGADKGGIARGSTLASELLSVKDTNQTLEQMFKTLDRLSKKNNLNFEIQGKINKQADVLANSGNPSSQTSPVVPIVAPTTNNTDNTRVVNNYHFYKEGSIDTFGKYSGMRLPVGF